MPRSANHIADTFCRRSSALLVILFISSSLTVQCEAQDTTVAPTTRQELWPEINFYYRLNEKFRLFSSISGTKLKSSSYTDGGFSVYLDYFALPVWRKKEARADSARGNLLWLRGGFTYSTTPQGDANPAHDYTIVTEANARFYLPWEILLIDKNRFDWRFRDGDFEPRYRPKITIERGFRTDYLTFTVYTSGEYYLNFNSSSVNRFRWNLGWEVRASKHISFETYFTHQFEDQLSNRTVNAVGLVIKFYWHKGEPMFGKKKGSKKNE